MQPRSADLLRGPAAGERFCLDGLSRQEKTALEDDLQLVIELQRSLLPQPDLAYRGWRIAYYYEPAGLVSGDYCDVVDAGKGGLYFMVGDVCGKGVAASIVTAHLHGMFRTMISMELPLHLMLERASDALCEGNLPYATLVCGRARSNGRIRALQRRRIRPSGWNHRRPRVRIGRSKSPTRPEPGALLGRSFRG